MRRQGHIICRSTAMLFLLALAGGCKAIVENGERSLNKWCEVGLEDLKAPTVDISEVTGGQDPEEVCELHLFDYDDVQVPVNFERIDPGQWSIQCEVNGENEESFENCQLDLEISLLHQYDDGMLLCQRPEGFCEPYIPGRRLVCQISDEPVEFGAFQHASMGGLATAAVLAVDTFDDDPELFAITWMGSDEHDSWPQVTWLRTSPSVSVEETEPFAEILATVDVCGGDCGRAIAAGAVGAPAHSYVSFQTATRDEALLLAGPCGSREVVEVFPDGRCQTHELTDPERDGTAPEIALGVVGTDDGPAALWTDGVGLYSSILAESGGEALTPEPARLVAAVPETQSRDDPSSLCVSGIGDGVPLCVTLWTEETRFPSALPGYITDPGDRSLHLGLFRGDDDLLSDNRLALRIDYGFAGQMGVDLLPGQDIAELTELISGLVVYRSSIFGLMVFRWNFYVMEALLNLSPEVLQLMLPFTQLTDIVHLADPALELVRGGGFLIAWMEADDEGVYRLQLDMVELPAESLELRHGRFSIRDFDVSHRSSVQEEAPRPLLASSSIAGPEEPSRLLFVGASGDDGSGCSTRFTLVHRDALDTALPPGGDWASEVTVSPLQSGQIDTPAACEPGCQGDALWVEDRFLLALPSAEGVRLVTIAPGEGENPEVLEVPISTTTTLSPSCHITLYADVEDGHGMVTYDVVDAETGLRSLRSLQLWMDEGEWRAQPIFVELDHEEDIEASTPSYASVFTSEDGKITLDPPLLSWTVHRFGGWKQRDFALGPATVNPEGSLEVKVFPSVDRPVLDSRIAVASGIPLPCDEQDEAVGDNLCAMIAYSCPNYSEYSDIAGYHRIEQFTPVAETAIVPVGLHVRGDAYLQRGAVNLVEGEPWRGLPTSLVQWHLEEIVDEEGPPVLKTIPVISFSKSSALDWGAGKASGFMFRAESGGSTSFPRWLAESLEPTWVFGGERQDAHVPFLRLAEDSGKQIGSVWSSLTRIEQEQERYAWTLNFGLLDGTLTPLAGEVRLDGIGDETATGDAPQEVLEGLDLTNIDRSFVANDPRFLAAEHLGAAVRAIDERQFVVAWVHKSWAVDPRQDGEGRPLDSVTFHAARVVCDVLHDDQ